MPVLAIVGIVVISLVSLVWATRHVMIWRERRSGFVLTGGYPGPPENAPKLSVLVAAKDEEHNIETCLRTLLEQDYPDFEIVAIDDRSDDATAEIIRRVAAEDDRVRLVQIDELPDGWCGKNHAMHHGAGEARGEYLCMVDADCRQLSERTLSVSMKYAQDTDADLLSVLPVLEMKTWWERVAQPVCGGVLMIWFQPDNVNDPTHPAAYANGAYILMPRASYDRIGGHEGVKGCVNEDIHLARRTKQAGLTLRVARSHGLYTVRMYDSLKAILNGWSRIFFGTFGTPLRLTASLLVLLVMGLAPYAAAIGGLAAGFAQGSALWLALGAVGVLACTLQLTVIYRFYRLIGAVPQLAWTYPIGCSVAMWAVLLAISKLRRGAKLTWRGTHYSEPEASCVSDSETGA